MIIISTTQASATITDTGMSFTASDFQLEFYLLDANDYLLIVKTADGSTTLGSFSNRPLAGRWILHYAPLRASTKPRDHSRGYLFLTVWRSRPSR